jgi:SAM-dependent methyltransferase
MIVAVRVDLVAGGDLEELDEATVAARLVMRHPGYDDAVTPRGDGPELSRAFGREAFGADPAAYDAVRPGYPAWVFDELVARGALRPGAATFEIGAGTGIATRALLARGAGPLLAIEPDPRLAAFLRTRCPAADVREQPFEDCALGDAAFDLGFCATAFHWLDEDRALRKIAAALKSGGWWVASWHVFGDDIRPDAFHDATTAILGGPRSPSAGAGGPPFALDDAARVGALQRAGAFDAIAHRRENWTLTLTADEVPRLYATYSPIAARPDRDAVLGELKRIAVEEFGGHITRNMTTILYVARRFEAP